MNGGPSREDIVFGRAVIAFRLATKEQVEACAADQQRLLSQGRSFTLPQVMVGRKLLSVEQYRTIVQEIEKRLAQVAPATGFAPAPETGPVRDPSDSTARFGARQVLAVPKELQGAGGGDGSRPTQRESRSRTPSEGRQPAIADSARRRMAQNGVQPRRGSVPLLPPDITPSGHYKNLVGDALAGMLPDAQPRPPPSDAEIEEAAKSWEDVGRAISSSSGADPLTLAARARIAAEKTLVDFQAPSEIPPSDAPSEPIPRTDDPEAKRSDPGFEVVPSSEVLSDSGSGAEAARHVTTPQAAKERRDAGIRKVLGVPEDAEEFDFGPYRILGEVASGGMGVIYRALETATGSVYALKALLNVENANEKQLKRFIQEAQSAMRLDHAGIVKIYDLGVFENIPYFTMDLVPGKDLHHLLRDKVYSPEKCLEILRKVCDAVDYAHKQGVIHRDLKPANIIVRPDGVPILTDFGLAKNLDSQFKLTAEGAMVGTPLYLSPEQVSGKGDLVDARCDVYGLGVMLYQILTDRLPFFGRNPYEVYRKVTEEDPPTPSSLNPAVSPEIERVCLMALAKSREERYQSAKALGEDIGRFLRGERVVAKAPTPMRKGTGTIPVASGASSEGPAAGGGASIAVIVGVVVFVLVILAGITYIIFALTSD